MRILWYERAVRPPLFRFESELTASMWMVILIFDELLGEAVRQGQTGDVRLSDVDQHIQAGVFRLQYCKASEIVAIARSR